MPIRSFKRFFTEATTAIFRNSLMSIASVIIVTACLFLFGIFLALTINLNSIGQRAADSCQLQVFVNNQIKDTETIENIRKKITSVAHVQDIEYETGKETFDNFKKGLSQEELAAFSGVPDSIISDSFKITLDDIAYAQQVTDKISAFSGIDRVENRQDIINFIDSATTLIKHVSIWVIAIFAIIGIFIISNTIKLTVQYRGKEINIMKYIGATDSFIRWPFIFEGVIVGLIGAVLAFLVVFGVYSVIDAKISDIASISSLFKIVKFSDFAALLGVVFVFFGGAIGAIGSAVSIRRYLKV